MNILGLNISFRKASKRELTDRYVNRAFPLFKQRDSAMLLSTVYRCVDVISDSIAQMAIETYDVDARGYRNKNVQNDLYNMVNIEPNDDMTRFTFIKLMVSTSILKGNAYAYISRTGVTPEQMIYIDSDRVSIEFIEDRNGIRRKRYRVSGWSELVEPSNMIHLLNFSYDGLTGVSTLTHAANSLKLSVNSENHASDFFLSGAAASGIVSKDIPRLRKGEADTIRKEFADRTDPITGKQSGIIVLAGLDKYTPITVSPKDSQLLESRQFNVVDICRFFGVSPVKAFDLSKSSYSTVEATQLAFLTDTLSPFVEKLEQEFNRKLFTKKQRASRVIKFNLSNILRADKQAQANYFSTLFKTAAITPNEIRMEIGLDDIDGGDDAYMMLNMTKIKNIDNGKEI